jgi:hypothetical protein
VFAKEVKMIGDTLRRFDQYKQLSADDQRAQKEKRSEFDNAMGTFISYLCQEQEAAIISHAKDYFEHQRLKTGCIVFDGCMVRINSPNDVSDGTLCGAADYAFEKTGYCIELVVKSLEPTPEDLVKLQPCPAPPQDLATTFEEQQANLNPRQKLILFSFADTLGAKKGAALRPGIELLKQLQAAGYAICIWSNTAQHNIPLQKMAKEHGVHFSVVLIGDECEAHRSLPQAAQAQPLRQVEASEQALPSWLAGNHRRRHAWQRPSSAAPNQDVERWSCGPRGAQDGSQAAGRRQ